LANVTLRYGLASGSGVFAQGGAVYSQGGLSLTGVTLQNNQAIGRSGAPGHCSPAAGGCSDGFSGAFGFGGALYISNGTATLTNVTLSANSARGGNGGNGRVGTQGGVTYGTDGGDGGHWFGGGLYAAGGTVTLLGSSATSNTAQRGAGGLGGAAPGGQPGAPGVGQGGGLYIEADSLMRLDEFTVEHVTGNTASNSHPNIYGPYQIIANPNPLPGDYNNDGAVDAADYVVWRKTDGTQSGYNTWRSYFGQAAGGGAGLLSTEPLSAAVPEQTSLFLCASSLWAIGIFASRRPWRDCSCSLRIGSNAI
jgi:hypothetical protein